MLPSHRQRTRTTTGKLSVKSRNAQLGAAAYTLVATEFKEDDY